MKQICSTKDNIIIEQFISMFIKFSKTTVLMLQFINYEMNWFNHYSTQLIQSSSIKFAKFNNYEVNLIPH